jgi:hypothetical protein
MKTHLSRIVASLLALTAGAAAYAECQALGCFSVYIDELYPEAGGGVWVQTSGNETLANCTANSGVFLRLDGTTAGFKQMYATLLAAQLADKKVSLRVDEGSNPCTIVYVTLNRNNW